MIKENLIKRAYLSVTNWIEGMRPPKTHVKFFYSDTPCGKYCEALLAIPAEDGQWWTIRHWAENDKLSIYLNDSEFNWLGAFSGDREEQWEFIPEYLHEKVRGLSKLSGHISQTPTTKDIQRGWGPYWR